VGDLFSSDDVTADSMDVETERKTEAASDFRVWLEIRPAWPLGGGCKA